MTQRIVEDEREMMMMAASYDDETMPRKVECAPRY